MQVTAQAIRDTVQVADVVFIVSHQEPDGDCIHSSLALAAFLRRQGKQVFQFNPGPFERREIRTWEPEFERRITSSHWEAYRSPLVIIVDCSTLDRIGDIAADVTAHPTVPVLVIDHHSAGVPFGSLRFVDDSAPASCYLVQLIIESWPERPTPAEANHLFFGLATDTGFFRHLDTDAGAVFHAAGRLVTGGVSPRLVYQDIHAGISLAGRRLIGRIIERVETWFDGRVAVAVESAEETRAVGRENRDSDLVYQALLATIGIEVVVFVREEAPKRCTVGLRSRDAIDVGRVARDLGGGGHRRASGFLSEATPADTKKRLNDRLQAEFIDRR